jgi:hypothetical protein
MPITINGTTGLAGVNGSSGTPAIQGGDANTGIFFGTDIIGFSEGGVEAARINADSQFVAAAGTAALPVITTTGDTNTGIFFPAADTIAFAEGGAEAMRIDSSGNLLVGTTTASNSSKFVISSTGSNFTSVRNITGGANHIYFQNPNGVIGSIETNGSATSYNTSSDYRLKENIAPMTGALAKVALLKPVTFKWKIDGSDSEGFIAHELQAIKPDCVSGDKDAVQTYTDEDGNEATRPAYQGVDTSFLVATLTAAIQEQQALITQLQADVAELKGTP